MGVVAINIASFADTFPAKRFARIIEDFKKDPASQGVPLDVLVCSLAIYKYQNKMQQFWYMSNFSLLHFPLFLSFFAGVGVLASMQTS